jgi:hypothetical protein
LEVPVGGEENQLAAARSPDGDSRTLMSIRTLRKRKMMLKNPGQLPLSPVARDLSGVVNVVLIAHSRRSSSVSLLRWTIHYSLARLLVVFQYPQH